MAKEKNGNGVGNAWHLLWRIVFYILEHHGVRATLRVSLMVSLVAMVLAVSWSCVARPYSLQREQDVEDRKALRDYTRQSVLAQEKMADVLSQSAKTQQAIEEAVKDNGDDIKTNTGRNEQQLAILQEALEAMRPVAKLREEQNNAIREMIDETKRQTAILQSLEPSQ